MKTAITDPRSLAVLSELVFDVSKQQTLYSIDQRYAWRFGPAAWFRSNAAEIDEVIVVEVFPGIAGIELLAIGFTATGKVFVAQQDEMHDVLFPLREAKLTLEQRTTVGHVIALVEMKLAVDRVTRPPSRERDMLTFSNSC